MSDDFETQYKGEVSKTGVAILPSKRMRKAPAQSAPENEENKNLEEINDPLELTEEVKTEEEKK